jgi:hypothetical protein
MRMRAFQSGQQITADSVNLRTQVLLQIGDAVEFPLAGFLPLGEEIVLAQLGGLKLRDEKSGV